MCNNKNMTGRAHVQCDSKYIKSMTMGEGRAFQYVSSAKQVVNHNVDSTAHIFK